MRWRSIRELGPGLSSGQRPTSCQVFLGADFLPRGTFSLEVQGEHRGGRLVGMAAGHESRESFGTSCSGISPGVLYGH